MTALLVRDLAQIASPGGSDAPLRGPRLREVSVTADAYVLCEEGRIVEVGSMADAPKLGQDVAELDGQRPLRHSGTRRLPYACVLRGRPGGRVRPPLGWGDLRRASCDRERHPLDRPSHARCGPRRARCGTRAPPRLDARARDHHVRSQVGLRARSGDRARHALRYSRRWRSAHLARGACCSPGIHGCRCLSGFRARGGTAGSGGDRGGGRRVPRAGRVRRPPGAALPRGVPGRWSRASAARRPIHGGRRHPPRGRARRPERRPPRGDRVGGREDACSQ